MEDFFKIIITIAVITAIVVGTWFGFAYRNQDYIRTNAVPYLEKQGYTVKSHEGHTGSYVYGDNEWYLLTDKKGYLYEVCITSWYGELQMYDFKCLNAISNKNE